MRAHRLMAVCWLFTLLFNVDVAGQVSSLGERARRARAAKIPEVPTREAPKIERNAVYDRYSWIATKPRLPKKFKVGDLITVIVREQRTFEADADLRSKKQLDLSSELEAMFKLTDKGIGAAGFRRGKPAIDYKFENKLRNKGDTQREDRLTTRVAGRIVDVKPNGVLVLEAKARMQHDDEISTMTLTGNCRKEDVTADNTILSTQISGKNIVVTTQGALRAVSSRGWLLKLLDWLTPF